MTSERFEADYLIECPGDPRIAAEVMAGEQSSGTFVPVPGETPELKARAAARIEALSVLETVAVPSLLGGEMALDGAGFRRAQVTLSWPLANIGT
ncbi:MAG: hypothetical protein ABI478_09920, partial [Propionivibrio sp.]